MTNVSTIAFRNDDIMSRRHDAIPRGVSNATSIAAARARNAEIWDIDGKRYIDFAGGIGVLNTGHCNPYVMEAVRQQLEQFTHTCFQVMPYETYVRLAERLNQLVPIAGPNKTLLLTTGAEAVENAIKIARAYTGRPGAIAFTGSFHGRTQLTMALTGKVLPYKKGVSPAISNVWHVPFPVDAHGTSTDEALKYLDYLFRADVDPTEVAAIIIEPVQGEGGFNQAPVELLQAVRQVCNRYGIVFIVDEIQSGFGRTGRMFAIEHFGIEPDLICLAKSLGGGLPLSAVVGRSIIMDGAEPGRLGGTYAGNPLACAAALAVLDLFADGKLLERSRQIGAFCSAQFENAAKGGTRAISNVRSLGAMVAFDLIDARTRSPDPVAAKRLTEEAARHGLIVLTCGTSGNSIRILVPLTVEDHILEEGCKILTTCLRTMEL